MANIYLIRHGQARFDQENYDQLSDLGGVQSEFLGKWLATKGQRAGRIVCGSLTRHRQTAAACVAAWGQASEPSVFDARLDEFDHWDIMARCWPEYRDHGALKAMLASAENPRRAFQDLFMAGVERWIDGRYDSEYRETWQEFRNRCVAGLNNAIGESEASQDLWIFTSGGPISAIAQHVLGVSDAKAIELSWPILNSSITKLVNGKKGIRLASFNTVAHLETAGISSFITYR